MKEEIFKTANLSVMENSVEDLIVDDVDGTEHVEDFSKLK